MARVLIVTSDFPPIVSGISTVFYNLFRCVEEKDFVLLASKAKDSTSVDKHLTFHVIRRFFPLGEGMLSKVLKTLIISILVLYYSKKLNIKRIHCGQILSAGIGGWLCKTFFSIPYVVWVCGSETIRLGKNRPLQRILKGVLDGAEVVVVNSEFTKEEYLRFGVDQGKIVKINPGVDTSIFTPTERPKELVDRFNLTGKKVILTVSRLDERKGHDKVIETLNKVKHVVPQVFYLVIGKGREEKRIKGLVDKLGLKDYVKFAGYIPDNELPLYYNLCDLFVLPNRITEESLLKGDYEGFGIVFLEASACGKAVIGGATGGAWDAVAQGETGFLVDPLSSDAIASAIIELLRNEDKAREMGKKGRDRAVKDFDWNVLSRRLEKIL